MKFGFIRNVTTDIVIVRVMSPRGLVGGYQHFPGGNSASVFRLKIETLCSTETMDNALTVISPSSTRGNIPMVDAATDSVLSVLTVAAAQISQ
jgi:hypothetical protein